MKTGIADIDMSKVFDAINVKTYTRTDRPELGQRAGFLAQDVRRACTDNGLPDTFTMSVAQSEDNYEVGTPGETTTLLRLDYSRLVTALWSKVKQLEARLQALEAQ